MSAEPPVISCKNAWKLFGSDPKKFLKTITPDMSFDDIRAQGYIAGVRDVSIDVHRGEMLVIMGLSGSGKSTLVRCFSRLHDITGGTISVEGQDIMSLAEKELIVAGLPCLDDLYRQKEELKVRSLSKIDAFKTILVAPSWGSKGCFTEYGTDFVKILSRSGYKVIIRLHPHSLIFEPEFVDKWRLETEQLENVSWDDEVQGTTAMSQADILISDASSIG